MLNVSQSLLGRMLKSRQEIENVSLANKNSDCKRKRVGKEEVEEALKQWFTKVREKDVRVTGPLLCLVCTIQMKLVFISGHYQNIRMYSKMKKLVELKLVKNI